MNILPKKGTIRKAYSQVAIKTPVLVLTIVTVTALLLYYFSVTSTVDVFEHFAGKLKVAEDGSLCIEIHPDEKYLDKINVNSRVFWYIDKQAAVYKASIAEIKKQNGNVNLKLSDWDEPEMLKKPDTAYWNKVTVDIKVGNEKLFDRLFKKGSNQHGAK